LSKIFYQKKCHGLARHELKKGIKEREKKIQRMAKTKISSWPEPKDKKSSLKISKRANKSY
jgi:hypothetical protein